MTDTQTLRDSFAGVDEVVADDLRFKMKLGIGEDAYASIKYGKKLQALWDVGGVAATGAGVAASGTVATTFFSSGGLMAALGLGATAVTPVGWVAAAAVMSGGAYYGVTRLFGGAYSERVTQIPRFINTPIDLLGSRLFDLIAPLAVRVARIDGDYDPRERTAIIDYFSREWGIAHDYADAALTVIEVADDDKMISALVDELAKFKMTNPDCNYDAMSKEVIGFLRDIAEADMRLDEREDMAIERIERALADAKRFSIQKSFTDVTAAISSVSGSVTKGASSAWSRIGREVKKEDE